MEKYLIVLPIGKLQSGMGERGGGLLSCITMVYNIFIPVTDMKCTEIKIINVFHVNNHLGTFLFGLDKVIDRLSAMLKRFAVACFFPPTIFQIKVVHSLN